MAETCTDFSKIICEIDEVKALLLSNGFKDEVNVNNIFEKLERKVNESGRVNEVVREIISELNFRQPDLIIIDEDQNSSEVEVLVDLRHDSTVVNEFGNVANRAKEIYEQERGIKRGGTYPSPEISKRAANVSLSDYLFEDSIPLEEVSIIEDIATLSTEELVLPVKPAESKEDATRYRRDGKLINDSYEITIMPEGSSLGEDVNYQTIVSDLPGVFMDTNKAHASKDAESSEGNLPLNSGFFEENALSLEKTKGIREVNALTAEVSGPNIPVIKSNRDPEGKIPEEEDMCLLDINSPEQNNVDHLMPVLYEESAHASNQTINGDTPKMLAQFDHLSAIFPHLNPSYLKQIVRQFSGDEMLIHGFIRSVFDSDLVLWEHQVEPKLNLENDLPSSSSKPSEGAAHWVEEGMEARGQTSVVSPQRELQVEVVGSSDNVVVMEAAVGGNAPSGAESQVGHPGRNAGVDADGNSGGEGGDLYAEQLKNLVAILPDADPTFLEGLVRDLEGNQERLKDFVANALDHGGGRPIYPTREEIQQKQEQEALIKRFTEKFSVEDFLQVFPDPIMHFENENREIESKYREHFMAYLRSKFRALFISDILSSLRKRKFNLTLTVQDLIRHKGLKRKTKRTAGDCKWPKEQSIPFLQEIAYIENKDKIAKYLKDKKNKRKQDFDEAKANNQLLTCGCCFDDELILEDMSTCRDGHFFCIQCIKKSTEVLIGDGKSSFPCMEGNCKAEFTLSTLQAILAPAVFGKLVQRMQAEEINAAGIEGLETCPSCPYSTIPTPEDKIFKCLNPECMKETCRQCKEPSHIPLRCDEVEKNHEIKARTYIENKMTEALVRTCWKCHKKFIKEGGCNKMSCSCGATMCYICRQPVKDYKHFNPYHDRPSELCPLYSNDGQLNFEDVKSGAEKAKEEVLRENPKVQLKHDPTLNLPEVPSTSKSQPVPPYMGQMLDHPHHPHHPHHLVEMIMEHVGNMYNPYPQPLHPRRNRDNHRQHRLVGHVPPAHLVPHHGHNAVQIMPYELPYNQEMPRHPGWNRAALPNRHHVYPPPPERNPARPHQH